MRKWDQRRDRSWPRRMCMVTYNYGAGAVSLPQRHHLCLPPCVAEVAPGVLLLCRCRAVPGSTPGTPVGASTKGADSEQQLGQIGWRLYVWGRERHLLSLCPGPPFSVFPCRCPGPAWRLLARASVPTWHLGDALHRLTPLPSLPGRAREAFRPTPPLTDLQDAASWG